MPTYFAWTILALVRGNGDVERETRFELATATLEGWNSTVELLPLDIKE